MSFTTALRCPHSETQDGSCPCKTLPSGRFSVWTAAEYGLLDATMLKADPSKVNALDAFGYTPLHYAAQHGRDEVVSLLLAHGAKPDLNACGATPLHRAAAAGSLKACELLIRAGADVNAKDTSFADELTPIMKASAAGHTEIVQLLSPSIRRNQCADKNNMEDSSSTSHQVLEIDTERCCSSMNENVAIEEGEKVTYDSKNVDSRTREPIVNEIMRCSLCNEPSLFMSRLNNTSLGESPLLVCNRCVNRT